MNRNTRRSKAHDRKLSKQGAHEGFVFGRVRFGEAVNSSKERKAHGRKAYNAPTL